MIGKIPVGEASSPVRLDSRLDRTLFEGVDPVGTGWSPVRLVKLPVGTTPVGRGDSPVGLGAVALSDGRIPVGRTPVGKTPVGKIPEDTRGASGLLGATGDCVGCDSEDGTPPDEPGMMNGPRIVVGVAELGFCEMGDALGETIEPGTPPVEPAGED